MTADDPLDEVAGAISDGMSVDWDRAESSAGLAGLDSSVRALREVSRIADFSRALQRPVSSPGGARGERLDRPSIAVLPFLNRGTDPADEYFSDGLADELVSVLSRIQGLHVAARTSSFHFKNKSDDLAVIGRKLHVATVLEGSVRKSGSRVRIAARLVRVSDGLLLWSETYDRTLEDIFAVQDDIAQQVVEELRAALLPPPAAGAKPQDARAEVAAAVQGRGSDAEAHRLFLQGRHFARQKSPQDLTRGVDYLRQALERDPEYALAWAELASAYADQAHFELAPIAEAHTRAREAVRRALELEPDLADAHARLARIQVVQDWDWYGAEASFLRALDRDPNNTAALHGAAVLLQGLGRSREAIELGRRAIAQDPLSTTSHHNLGCVYYESGRLAEAEAALRTALELAPQRYVTRSVLGQVLQELGRNEEALAQASLEPDPMYRLLALAMIHHRQGRPGASDGAVREMTRHGDEWALQIAEAHGSRGDADPAFRWLERAFALRDIGLAHIKPSPHFRSIRSDPRWSGFLSKLGIEVD